MASFTVVFTGNSSVLQADFFPEIVLDPNAQYSCALLDFSTYNSIANIVEGKNNELKYKIKSLPESEIKTIKLPTSMYEVDDILKYLKSEFRTGNVSLTYDISEASSTVQITFDNDVIWLDGSILNVIGFENENSSRLFKKNWKYRSTHIAKITDIDVIRIECDIISDSYINGKHCHTLHQFSNCKVPPGYKFIEVPQHIVYLPVKERELRSIQISIVDQNGNLIDFRGEQISCRIHIKKN